MVDTSRQAAAARSTRHLIDPDLLPMLDVLPALPISAATLPDIRAGLVNHANGLPDPVLTPVEITVDAPDGPLSVMWFDPAPGAKDRPALLYIHGGGMVLGSARRMTQGPAALAMDLGLPVASVDYRLAPETPFPGPQEDCYAALTWMAHEADGLGLDPARIGVTGESAGAGLATAVAHMARDRGGPRIAAQILIYPMLDWRVGGEADPWRNRHTGEFIWTRESNQFGWSSLRGDYGVDDERKGWFSPAIADDLAGLSPAWIGVGGLDLFLDEDLDYARRLTDAGVEVELHVYPGAFHGFNMVGDAPVIRQFGRDFKAGVLRLLGLGR